MIKSSKAVVKMFLSAGNNQYFVFDFNVDNSYKWVKVWVERHEFGGKVSSSELSAALSENKGIILAGVSEFEKMKNNWTIVVNNGGATSTSKSSQEYDTVDSASLSAVCGTNNSKDISINDNEIVLSSICYNKSNSISPLTDEFYNNPDENKNELANYDLVYLLKCKFYKENPNKES